MRPSRNRFFALVGSIGVATIGLVAAATSAAAHDSGRGAAFSTQVFASGNATLSAPDDITAMRRAIFVAWQNGVGPMGEPAKNGNTQSTVVEYTSAGRPVASWNLTGRVDGMTADSARDRIIATVNEDGDTSLYTIQLDARGASQVIHYTYSPNPPPHGGGTDAPHIYRGQLFISASNPSDPTQPAVYRAMLAGTTATLSPVFFDDSTATVANMNSPQYGQPTMLALTDPDSNTVVPGSSPRFRHDFMLDSQGDQQQIYAQNAGTANQKLFVLNLSQSVDDTAWATAARGTLYITDAKANDVVAVRGRFVPGTAFSAVTPGNANNAPANPGPNYLATLDLNTGNLTPVPGVTAQAKGLVFVGGNAGEDEGED